MRLSRALEVWKLGMIKYSEALTLQEKLVSDRKESELERIGAELYYTQRGGDITYHGPRQAILYPIISLRDMRLGARNYVEKLELTMIELSRLYGINACPGKKCETGVWVGERKIGAIGVRISSGITSHGLAFNIDPDLEYFKHIVPCGIADKEVTSLMRETGTVLPSEEVIHEQLISCFAKQFGYSDIIWKENDSVLLSNEKSE